MTHHDRHSLDLTCQPRAFGEVVLTSKRRGGDTVVDRLFQSGSARVVFPRARQGLSAVLLNNSGGITGGDLFDYQITAQAGSYLTVSTQACERAYKAQPGQIGRQSSRLEVQSAAHLDWLPQETLLFDGCALDRKLECDLAEDATALIVEPLVLGRIAMGENIVRGLMRDEIIIRRQGDPIYLDRWQLAGELTELFDRPAIGAGARAMASIIWVDPRAESYLNRVRDMLGDRAGASLLAPGLMVIRLLAQDSFMLRAHMVPLLDLLSSGNLPICWRL